MKRCPWHDPNFNLITTTFRTTIQNYYFHEERGGRFLLRIVLHIIPSKSNSLSTSLSYSNNKMLESSIHFLISYYAINENFNHNFITFYLKKKLFYCMVQFTGQLKKL